MRGDTGVELAAVAEDDDAQLAALESVGGAQRGHQLAPDRERPAEKEIRG